MRALGRTGEKLSLLTLGTAHLRSSLLSRSEIKNIVERALELGVNSIDTAPNYDDSEVHLGEVLKPHRDKIFLATKNEEATYKSCWALLEKSLERLQTDHVDLVYIHNFGVESRFPDVKEALGPKGTLGALTEAKKKGLIRYIGISGHFYPSRFKPALDCDEIDVYLLALNFVERYQYNFEEKIMEPALKKNCGVVAMKTLGGAENWSQGTARFAGEHYETALRYVLGLPGITTLNIGARSVGEVDRAVQTIKNYQPFSDEEQINVEKLGKELAKSLNPLFGTPIT